MRFLSSTVELERIISDAQGVVYYGAHRLSELIGFYRCPTLSKNGQNGVFLASDDVLFPLCRLHDSLFIRSNVHELAAASDTVRSRSCWALIVNILSRSINNDIDTIELDRSTETALLWSSGGVKSLVLNQWNSTMTENESVLINAFTGNWRYVTQRPWQSSRNESFPII